MSHRVSVQETMVSSVLVSRPPGLHPSLLPAAAEEEQVLDSRNCGVSVLASDQMAVQHHVHSVGLTGTEASTRVLHKVLNDQW